MDPRVYRALATPLVGHVDPWFRGCMDDVQVLLRQIFQTENRITMPLSASGSGGIEASVVNTLEEGDEALNRRQRHFFRPHGGHRRPHTRQSHQGRSALRPSRRSEDVRRAGKGKKNQNRRLSLTAKLLPA